MSMTYAVDWQQGCMLNSFSQEFFLLQISKMQQIIWVDNRKARPGKAQEERLNQLPN